MEIVFIGTPWSAFAIGLVIGYFLGGSYVLWRTRPREAG